MDFFSDYSLTINGQAYATPQGVDIINPASGDCFATAPRAGALELDRAVAAARAAFPAWAGTPYAQRQHVVRRIADLLEQHQDSFARLLTMEQGKPLAAAAAEVGRALFWCREMAGYTLPETQLNDDPERIVTIRHTPLGVAGAIVPWNFPMTLALWKIAPALVTGNTMVLKPSPYTPLTALKLGELLRSELPPGVFNVISGGDDLGPLMSSHPGFDKLAFTGSTVTGRRVMQSASATLKRITLELGGNDPAIVMDDVDVADLAPKLFWACFANSAQYCLASKRVYIHERIYDKFCAAVAAYGRTVKVGNGLEPDSQLGPVQNRQQYERVVSLLEDCKSQAYRFLLGGDVPSGRGYFVSPTIVDNPPDGSRIVQEEPFGPIVPFLKFSTVDEVIERANATEYGLGASVWCRDVSLANQIADRLQAGMIWINEIHKLTPHAPLAGHKQSGLGEENGLAGLLSYTNVQTRSVSRAM